MTELMIEKDPMKRMKLAIDMFGKNGKHIFEFLTDPRGMCFRFRGEVYDIKKIHTYITPKFPIMNLVDVEEVLETDKRYFHFKQENVDKDSKDIIPSMVEFLKEIKFISRSEFYNNKKSEELLMLEIIWLKLLSMEEKIKELKNA